MYKLCNVNYYIDTPKINNPINVLCDITIDCSH